MVNNFHCFPNCATKRKKHNWYFRARVKRNCEVTYSFEILTNSFLKLFCPSNTLNINIKKWNEQQHQHVIELPSYQG